jgi:phosphohistidine phosphatase
MKTLYIMRHPEKETNSKEDDFFVPLTAKGIQDAHNIANQLKTKQIHIDLIVSSPSLRTETTSLILAQDLNIKKSILYNEVLYQGYLDELLDEIAFTFHNIENLLIVGHNPLLSNLANHFTGYKDKLETSMVMKIEFSSTNWVDINSSNVRNASFLQPPS